MNDGQQIGPAWRKASQRIARLDARLLLEHICGCRHSDLIAHPERRLRPDQEQCFEALVTRREAGEPLAYLLGTALFCDLEFTVTPDVLIPRPDTEVLVRQAERIMSGHPAPHVVDLGTGSGIVAIALAKRRPHATVSAVDISAGALGVARINAARHQAPVRFLEGSWFAPLDEERFDLIVSNPPYVADGDPHLGLNGLPFEPQSALTDGVANGDGLACIQTIIDGAGKHLASNGWLLIEHGYDQAVKVRRLLQEAGFSDIASWRDDAGIERVSGGQSKTTP